MGESLGSHSLHSFAEFLESHINSPEASFCQSSRLNPLHVLKPFSLHFMATEKSARKGGRHAVVIHPKICRQICTNYTRQTLKKPMVNARIESNGFEDIGQKSGSDTASSPRNMQRRMPSRHPGMILCTEIFHPGIRLKLLSKASILAWCADHNLRMLALLHYSGVVKTVCSSATTSLPKTQLQRTRRI